MSVLLRLERRIEAIVEGVFARWAHDRVHPVQIARRLFRAMDEGAVAGLRGVMLPNEYRVVLNPADFEPYRSLAAPLVAELEAALRSRAEELDGYCPGGLRVALGALDGITPGEIYVEARFVPDAPSGEGASGTPEASAGGDTRIYRRRGGRPAMRLRVQTGPPGTAGREFALDRPMMTVGRRSDQDIVLDDASVSRAHARIDVTPDGATIVDVGSTNGTRVNGRPVDSTPVPLRARDRIQLGAVSLDLVEAP